LRCHPTVSPLGDGMDAAKKFEMKKLKSATKEGLDLEDDGEEKKKAWNGAGTFSEHGRHGSGNFLGRLRHHRLWCLRQ